MSVERGGGTLSEIYQSTKKLLLRTRDGLRLERLEYSSGIDSPDLFVSIRNDVSQIQSLCADMDRLWCSVGAESQRDLWRRKVEQVAEEAESLREILDKYSLMNQRKVNEARERVELLGRANGESSHVIIRVFDEEVQAMQSARNSSRMLDEATSVGEAILSKYAGQREHIKAEKIATLVKSANINVEAFWPNLFAKLAEKKDLGELISNVGCAGGAAAPVAVPAGAAATAPAAEEKKEEPEEESDDDMGISLFDD